MFARQVFSNLPARSDPWRCRAVLASSSRSLVTQPIRYYAPNKIVIGADTSKEELPAIAKCIGMRNPLIITDPFLHKSGLVQGVFDGLSKSGLTVRIFSDTVPEPSTAEVERGVQAFRDGQHDGIVAFGGGSPIDVAKVVSVLIGNGGKVRDYKVPNEIPRLGPPVIAVPTTAGTGSEVTRAAVISDLEADEKMLLMSPMMVATAAVVDYKLTMTCPLRITADTGLDALTHAIEAYVSVKASPMTDPLAIQAMSAIRHNIRKVCANLEDEDAREAMMLAATQAGLAFSNASVALVHGMSRPLGVHFHVPHGLSNAMLLPTVTEFSVPWATARYADCARAMGLVPMDGPDADACTALVRELDQLNQDLKVPSLADFGVDEEKFMAIRPLMAEQALASGSPGNNPRVPSVNEMVDLYATAYSNDRLSI